MSLSNVSREFGGLVALDHVNISAMPGQVRGLIGPNGAGKSTLVNICTGITTPNAGHIYLDGQDITGMPSYKIAEAGLARTFQNVRLLGNATVLENVLIACEWVRTAERKWRRILRRDGTRSRIRARECLDLVGMAAFESRLAGELPYGTQRLVEVARAMARAPKVLLLDEPVAGLRPQEIDRLARVIRQMKENRIAVIVIEHNMPFILSEADQVTVLNFGKVIADGPPGEIARDERVIEAYLGRKRLP